ncbi:hypothetical protein MELA_02290 [Candidatus Methylomirabilis lanthanidiphila]|uniref:Uncharacterized protein n=1 Tax=Candidatus Methylomirabilis lanthanidiphila TaxID=2211376 RepID=A0A564ZL58_9BACT|nr:hypothetical protein [Candidatus Methylomirabilis lanthanidiphila]VUZ85903.1 hypothetical protein MELA_02290 [Candidatus Methylomirabilis lanthanidiphila]
MDSAVLVARHAGVRIVNSCLDDIIEIASGLGIGALTSIFLTPWVGVPVGAGVRYGLKKSGFPANLTTTVTFAFREGKLKDVAAGRIETEWSGGG